MKLAYFLSASLLLFPALAHAGNIERDGETQDEGKKVTKGFVTGGLETNTIYYINDSRTGAERPDGSLGSNNYLKVDFGYGMFEGGLQGEAYFPAIQGYPEQYKGFVLASKYARIRYKGFTASLGDFYDQFGSGLLFRAYEDRALGMNTAVEGIHLGYNWDDKIRVKGFIGRPKLYTSYSGVSRVAGADVSLDLMSLCGSDLFNLNLEGSFFNKHQALESDWMEGIVSPDINGVSARLGFEWQNLSLRGEYVIRTADASVFNGYNTDRSDAILVEGSYSIGGFGANLTFRKIRNAGFQSDYTQSGMFTCLNYIPSLTQQHTYSLASLNPYQAQSNGEIGGQADLYYFFPRHSVIGGAKGMRVHANFSTYYGPRAKKEYTEKYGQEIYFRDLTLDMERWWGRHIKTILLYTWQTYNNRIGVHPSMELRYSHTIVADVTCKINPKHSLRGEYQHLWTMQDQGNWCAGTIEYTISPGWSFSVSDMWNYGFTRTHYFNGGVSYSHGHTRVGLNFGRFREGYQCSGGVCRLIPAYTGANFTLTTSF